VPNDWVVRAEQDRAIAPRRYRAAQDVKRYLDPARKHLHLLDGGLADNIGVRSPLHSLGSHDVPQQEKGGAQLISGWSVRRLIDLRHTRHVMVIVVNARTNRTSDGSEGRRSGTSASWARLPACRWAATQPSRSI
jgi:NTE family protein